MKVDMPRDCGLQSPDYGGKDFKISPENVQLVYVGGEEAINLIRMLSKYSDEYKTSKCMNKIRKVVCH